MYHAPSHTSYNVCVTPCFLAKQDISLSVSVTEYLVWKSDPPRALLVRVSNPEQHEKTIILCLGALLSEINQTRTSGT